MGAAGNDSGPIGLANQYGDAAKHQKGDAGADGEQRARECHYDGGERMPSVVYRLIRTH